MTYSPIDWFRHSAPYINTHRNKTFVIVFGGEAICDPHFATLVYDIALLHSLGIRLVIVHGARPQIELALQNANIDSHYHQGIRITPAHALPHILSAIGKVRLDIEAHFSKGLANSPMFGAKISTISGNFVNAKPFGVHDGIDYQLTGEVRRIDKAAICHNLDQNHIVLLGSVGFSLTGDIFNLEAFDVATHVAATLQADKLILFSETLEIVDSQGMLIHEMTTNDAKQYLGQSHNTLLSHALSACTQGVARAHLLSYKKDGALIEELFTTDGSGTMISQSPYENIRQANIDDIMGIITLIRPLEAQGFLVTRSRQHLEEEIEHFYVIERDGKIIGCAALYPLDKYSSEIASVAIAPEYRRGSRGVDLLNFITQHAKACGNTRLFALTTRTAHWFIEQGFCQTTPESLPPARLAKYHNGRNSKVLVKMLT